jgi:methionyl-tRNA formyltransferase
MKQVIVMGKGDLAIKVADWFRHSEGHNLAAIVPVKPEPAWTSSFSDWARENSIEAVASGHYKDLPQLATGSSIDLVVSVFYDKIIKAWFIERCTRIINLHNGPLPKYRGVSPINWALKNQEDEHGITIHEITPGIDDGPIIAQLKYSIYPEIDEVADVYKRSLEYGWILFQQTIPMLDRIRPHPQEHESATYYSRLDNSRLGERQSFTREASATTVA